MNMVIIERAESRDMWEGRGAADLCAIAGNVVEDSAIRAVAKSTALPFFWIVLIAIVESLGSEIEGIAKGFVDGLKGVSASHKYLGKSVSSKHIEGWVCGCTRSKAVEQALG